MINARRIQFELAGRVVGPALAAFERAKKLRRRGGAGKKVTPFGPPLEATRKLKELTKRTTFVRVSGQMNNAFDE